MGTRRRGYAGAGAQHWYHHGTIRYMDRDGDVRVLRSPGVPQVSTVGFESLCLHFTVRDRCSSSSFFDRRQLNEARNLKCPFNGCNFMWCKGCQQEIIPHGPQHSCDGSSEMKHLVHQRGWKYCPSKC